MRIGVLGAGAVGGALAALLDRAGHEVVVTARGEHGDAIRLDGLRLTGGWGGSEHPLVVVDRLTRPIDLIVLASKTHDSAAALEAAAGLDGVPVLVVQNGLGGSDAVRDALPHSPVAIGLALFAASLVAPGLVEITGPAPLAIGGDAAAVAVALPLLREALPTTVDEVADVQGAQWTKLLINQVNALPAITGLSVQTVVAHDGLRHVLTASMRETARVGRALGVAWQTIGSTGLAQVAALLADDPVAGESVPLGLVAGMGSVPNPASTLQSIRRGRITEIDALNGAVVREGRRSGVATPVNAALVALVHEVERAGAFLPVDVVIARVARGER